MKLSPWQEALDWARRNKTAIGIDEVGRGCLAGPLVVAAAARSLSSAITNICLLNEEGQLVPVYLIAIPADQQNITSCLNTLIEPQHQVTGDKPSFPAFLSASTQVESSSLFSLNSLRNFCLNWLQNYLLEAPGNKVDHKKHAIPLEKLNDSKKLSPQQRQKFTPFILKHFHTCLVIIPPTLIDRINILQATLLGMATAAQQIRTHLLESLQNKLTSVYAFIDGPHLPPTIQTWSWPVINGDAIVTEISAASIVAKVFRDEWMKQLDACYPGYSWSSHKGYGTAAHLKALNSLGPTPLHRMSFAPVAQASKNQQNLFPEA